MKWKKKGVAVCTALILCLAALTGCGTKKTDESKQRTAFAGQATLQVAYWGGDRETAAMQAVKRAFEEHLPGATVELVCYDEEVYDNVLAGLASTGKAPQFAFLRPGSGEALAGQGLLADWNLLMEKDSELSAEDFIAGTLHSLSPGGVWGVGAGLDTYAVFYDESAFIQAGAELLEAEQWNWTALRYIASQLTRDENGNGPDSGDFAWWQTTRYGIAWVDDWDVIRHMAWNNGADITMDGTDLSLTSSKATSAIQYLADLANPGYLAPDVSDHGALNLAEGIQNGTYAMAIGGQSLAAELDAASYAYGVLPLPAEQAGDTTALLVESYIYGLFLTGDETLDYVAWEFAKFMCTDAAGILYQNGLGMPALGKYYEEPSLLKTADEEAAIAGFEQLAQIAAAGTVQNTTLLTAQGMDEMVLEALTNVWWGGETAESAILALQRKIKIDAGELFEHVTLEEYNEIAGGQGVPAQTQSEETGPEQMQESETQEPQQEEPTEETGQTA